MKELSLFAVLLWFYMIGLLEVGLSVQEVKQCDNLESYVSGGKWKSYEFVLNDCIVRRFIDAGGEEINFISLIEILERLVLKNTEIHEKKVEEVHLTSLNKVKKEIALRTAKRNLSRHKIQLSNMLVEDQVRVSMLESEIRDNVGRCYLAPPVGVSRVQQLESCKSTLDVLMSKARELSNNIRAKCALLVADWLALNEPQKQEETDEI